MSFADAVRTCFRKYATFSGRAGRPEFWWFALFGLLGNLLAGLVDAALFPTVATPEGTGVPVQPVSAIFGLVVLLPSLAVGARRLHDIGRSGWWLLITLVPLLGLLVLLWFFTRPSVETRR